jgi:guanidinoacetate N-methyltransferase
MSVSGSEAEHWNQSPALYDEHTLKIAGQDVMEDWELPYMRTLARIASSNGGSVLEVGYGMGLASAAIQATSSVQSHTLIECHPDVISRCILQNREAFTAGKMRLLTGLWQDTTPLLADRVFDGILFDTYPIRQEEFIGPHMFFFAEAHRLLRPGGVLTYYSDEESGLSIAHHERLEQAGFEDAFIDFEVCPVTPPPDCEYWKHDSIVAPIIRKTQQLAWGSPPE